MLKIDTLRAALIAALPELRAQPDRVRLWVDRGAAQSRQTASFSFAFSFRLNVLLVELRSDISVVALAIFNWLQVNQPALLAPHADGFIFDVDILDNSTADVLVQIDLTQNVAVTPQDGGDFRLEYLPEPDPLFDDPLGLGGVTPVPPLDRITLDGGETILPDDEQS